MHSDVGRANERIVGLPARRNRGSVLAAVRGMRTGRPNAAAAGKKRSRSQETECPKLPYAKAIGGLRLAGKAANRRKFLIISDNRF